MDAREDALRILNEEVVVCQECPRLATYREKVAAEKRRAYRDWTYCGRLVPGFGDPPRNCSLSDQRQERMAQIAPAAWPLAIGPACFCTRRYTMRISPISPRPSLRSRS